MSASLSVDRKETAAAGRLSKIPRPEKGLKKWDSTPTLEVIFFYNQGDFNNLKYDKVTKKLHAVLNCLLKVIVTELGRESK